MGINIKSNQKPGNTLASRTMSLNFVNLLVCIWLTSDWFNNNQLLSELTHAHYREPVPLNYLEKLSFFGRWKTLSAASEIMQETHLCDYRISKFSGQACPQIPLPGGPGQFFARVSNSVAPLFKILKKPLQDYACHIHTHTKVPK